MNDKKHPFIVAETYLKKRRTALPVCETGRSVAALVGAETPLKVVRAIELSREGRGNNVYVCVKRGGPRNTQKTLPI